MGVGGGGVMILTFILHDVYIPDVLNFHLSLRLTKVFSTLNKIGTENDCNYGLDFTFPSDFANLAELKS